MPFDGSKLDDVTLLLIKGREQIEQGWCQNTVRRGKAVCMLGAILPGALDGAGGTAIYNAAWSRLCIAIGCEVGERHLANWNDDRARTKDEVLEAFNRAIALGVGE